MSDKKVLTVYFSASGITKKIAEKLSSAIGSDLYEIKPATPYTKADLNWMDKNSRSTIEMRNPNVKPEIVEDDFSVENYDVIFLGFPIWWYIAPTIVNTFLEKHDFSNKKIVLFATSGGSRFGKTVENLRRSVSMTTEIVEGDILNNQNSEKLKQWAEKFLQ